MAEKEDSPKKKGNTKNVEKTSTAKPKDVKSAKESSKKNSSDEKKPVKLTKTAEQEGALKLFEDKSSETAERDTGLEKADLSVLGNNTGLRGRHKKNQGDEENEAIKRNIILAAQNLLKLAGTSVEELNGGGKEVKKGGFGNNGNAASKVSLMKAGEKDFMENDLAVVTHGDVNQFDATKITKDELKEQKETFNPNKKDSEALDDPFDTGKVITSTYTTPPTNPLHSKYFSSSRDVTISTRKGFFHYFGITAISLVALGSIAFGIFFLTNLLTNSKDPTYSNTEGTIGEQVVEVAENTVKVKTPLSADNPAIAEAKSVAENFLSADSKRFAYTFIIQNKGVSKTFNKYWEKAAEYNSEFLTYEDGYTLPNQTLWVSYLYGKGEDLRRLVLMKAEDNPFRIDWQTYSEIEQTSLADLIKEVKTDPFVIRTWVSPQHFYSSQYPDEHWQNYLAHDIKGNTLNCYAPLSTKSAQSLYQSIVNNPVFYPKADEEATGAYVKLMVRKPKIGAEFVEIMEVLDTTWFPELGEN